jgi:hypothetical protein
VEEDGIPLQVLPQDGLGVPSQVSVGADGMALASSSGSMALASDSGTDRVDEKPKKSAKAQGKERTIYVNMVSLAGRNLCTGKTLLMACFQSQPLPSRDVYKGEPIVRYVRNKVRTSSECRRFLPTLGVSR